MWIESVHSSCLVKGHSLSCCPSSLSGHVGAGVVAAPQGPGEEGEGVAQQTLGKPFVEVQWEMLHHNPSILYFRALLLQIQVIA